MTRNKRMGKRIWWGLLVLWVLCFGAGIFYLFGIFWDFGVGLAGSPSFLASYLLLIGNVEMLSPFPETLCVAGTTIYIGLFIFTQWLFLSSKKHWKIKTQSTGRPMKKAVVGVAFATMLLSVGFVFSLIDLTPQNKYKQGSIIGHIILSLPIILWIIWSIIFSIYFYQKDYLKWSGKIIKGLIGGSILELFVSIPIFVTREDDCYCARGSYAGLVFGVTVLLWAFGPGIFLLYWREKKRLEEVDSSDNSQKSEH
jgi:hypothetical protein